MWKVIKFLPSLSAAVFCKTKIRAWYWHTDNSCNKSCKHIVITLKIIYPQKNEIISLVTAVIQSFCNVCKVHNVSSQTDSQTESEADRRILVHRKSTLNSMSTTGPKIVCFLTRNVQLTLSSVQLTLLKCVMWSSKMQWRFLMEMISYLHNIPWDIKNNIHWCQNFVNFVPFKWRVTHNTSRLAITFAVVCWVRNRLTQMYLRDGVPADLVTCSVLVLHHLNIFS